MSHHFQAGETIRCVGNRNCESFLTKGKDYICLYGTEPGIVPDKPYVTVIGDGGKKISAHASRFVSIEKD